MDGSENGYPQHVAAETAGEETDGEKEAEGAIIGHRPRTVKESGGERQVGVRTP